MSLHRKDLSDDRNPNPTKDQQYQQPERKQVELEGRSFADTNIAADERQQADGRNSGPPTRGNRTDDVQSSDRAATTDGDLDASDRAERTNAARTQRDFERREATDENV